MYWVYYVTRETPCHNRKRYSIRFTAIAGKRFQIDFGDVNISIIQPFNSLYGFILFIFLFSFCPPFISLCDTLSPILVWIHAKRRLETINKQNQIYSKGTREPHVTRRHSFIVIVAGVHYCAFFSNAKTLLPLAQTAFCIKSITFVMIYFAIDLPMRKKQNYI